MLGCIDLGLVFVFGLDLFCIVIGGLSYLFLGFTCVWYCLFIAVYCMVV